MSAEIRRFARGDAARLHCHRGRQTRVRRFNHPLPPLPEPVPSKRGHLVAIGICAVLAVAALWFLLGEMYAGAGLR